MAHVAAEPFRLVRPSVVFARIATWLGFERRLDHVARAAVRVAFYLLVTWIAPMVLASFELTPGALSFAADFETHLRAFVAIPLLLLADGQVDPAIRYIVRLLMSPRRCREPERVAAIVRSLRPWTAHPLVTVGLLGIALLLVPRWAQQHASGGESWIFRADDGGLVLTTAGTWQAFVVVPVYLFLLLRWLWRWLILGVLFARAAPLLRPVVTHGDRCGSFSFVSFAPERFAWVVAGASCLVSARWLFQVVHEGVAPKTFGKPAVAVVSLAVMFAFAPLFGFLIPFVRAKRVALFRYRTIVEGHARNVEHEWSRQSFPAHVTSEQSSSLTDLNSIYECARSMRVVPIRRAGVVAVALAAIVPMLPVLARITPIDQALRQVLQALL
jgi:hypothetical protein